MLLIENFKFKMTVLMNIVLYVWLSLGGDVSPSNYTIRELLPELIRQFCPRSNVCPENTGISAESTIPWLTSCCTGCSCAAECEQRNDCCFPKKTIQNDVKVNLKQTTTLCLWPMTIETLDERAISYNMITDIPGNQGTACGDVSVAVWESMHPVYSNKTKLIYKNTVCAEAYGVTDGVAWNLYVSCDLFSEVNGTYTLATHFMSGFDKSNFPRDCYVYFEYPGEKKDLAPHICYKDVIESCPDTDFSLDDYNALNVSRQMIREACYSGLFSLVKIRKSYANVFCYVCNSNDWSEHMTCRYVDDNTTRIGNDGFVGLINSNVLTTTLYKTSEMPNVCPESVDVDVACRPLQCPAGQFRTKNGDCDQLFGYWYIKPIGVHLTLTSNVGFNITGVLPSSRAFQEFTSLLNPWPSSWKLILLSYERLRRSL